MKSLSQVKDHKAGFQLKTWRASIEIVVTMKTAHVTKNDT